jgi:hypothetical protein
MECAIAIAAVEWLTLQGNQRAESLIDHRYIGMALRPAFFTCWAQANADTRTRVRLISFPLRGPRRHPPLKLATRDLFVWFLRCSKKFFDD